MVKIKIETENAAFTDNQGEVSRILHRVAELFWDHGRNLTDLNGYILTDLNGNRIGTVEVTD